MSELQETPVSVTFVLDSASPRPRVRLEVGTWYECEIMPPDRFFELCAEYWSHRNDPTTK